MELKYHDIICEIPNCPPTVAEATAVVVFRFFFEDLEHANNYQPPCKIKPDRKWKTDADRCDGFGLSMFYNEEDAESYFKVRHTMSPNIGKKIGDCMAKGNLQPSDGWLTDADQEGHFSLFEADSCNLSGRFSILRKIVQ